MFCCNLVHTTRIHQELTQCINCITNIRPSIHKIVQWANQSVIQSRIKQLWVTIPNLRQVCHHRSVHRISSHHPKYLKNRNNVLDLAHKYPIRILPNFQPQIVMHEANIFHLKLGNQISLALNNQYFNSCHKLIVYIQ